GAPALPLARRAHGRRARRARRRAGVLADRHAGERSLPRPRAPAARRASARARAPAPARRALLVARAPPDRERAARAYERALELDRWCAAAREALSALEPAAAP